MSKFTHVKIATAALVLASTAVAAYLLIVFVVPKLEQSWRGAPLAGWQRGLVDWSRSAASTRTPLFLVVLVAFTGALAWRMLGARALRRRDRPQGFPVSGQ